MGLFDMRLETIYACIIATIVIILAYVYITSDYYYINRVLQNAFHELNNGDSIRELNPDINWKVINMEIDGYINNKKIVTNLPDYNVANSEHAENKFENKNAIAAFLNNVIVFDIDSNDPLILTGSTEPVDKDLPKDTVIAKSPHGYHYYFYNDTDEDIPCYVGLRMNGVKHPIDLLTGHKQLIFMPPTRIENACYRWINSPTTHRIAPISKYHHIVDLFAHTKEFSLDPETPNMCISNAIPHLMCIVWDFHIIYQLKYKCISTKFEKLRNNEHEMLYRTQTTYYLFLKHAPLKYFTAPQFITHVEKMMQQYGINGGIVHLCSGITRDPTRSIMQFESCHVHNHEKHKLNAPMVRSNHTLVQTSAITTQSATIISSDVLHAESHEMNDAPGLIVNNDMFVIMELSNRTRVPCVCLMQVVPHDRPDDQTKFTKLVQYYFNNVLNATHHTKHPQKVLPFFSEVPLPML